MAVISLYGSFFYCPYAAQATASHPHNNPGCTSVGVQGDSVYELKWFKQTSYLISQEMGLQL